MFKKYFTEFTCEKLCACVCACVCFLAFMWVPWIKLRSGLHGQPAPLSTTEHLVGPMGLFCSCYFIIHVNTKFLNYNCLEGIPLIDHFSAYLVVSQKYS